MAPRRSPRAWRWPLALLLTVTLQTALSAQSGGLSGGGKPQPAVKLKFPAPSQVFQRNRNDQAVIPIALDESVKNATIVSATLSGPTTRPGLDRVRFADGKLTGVPTGGPYQLQCLVKIGESPFPTQVSVGPIFVGDLWVLAGQSNMQGVGDLIDVTPPSPSVMALGMDGKWVQAEEPLHWLVDSPDPVHSGDSATQKKRSEEEHKTRTKGAGLGLPFAVAMVEKTGVPIGLVICAHGGTSMEQWNPAKKNDGGASLYGSMIRQVKLAGGKVAGVLWYQGESDAMGGAAEKFPKVFADFIAAVRSDFNDPELPFYYVQIGRFVNTSNPKGWNAVQDAQRRLPDQVPNTAVISVIDLELDDLIHVGTQGLKRAGKRLAQIALRESFGQEGATTPTFDRVNRGTGASLVVKFRGVNMGTGQASAAAPRMAVMRGPGTLASAPDSPSLGLRPARHIAGFSIRKEDGAEIPLIFEATVGSAKDTVILKLIGPVPEKSFLWYGYGLDPHCNLTDGLDMAVPVFGPIPLDGVK